MAKPEIGWCDSAGRLSRPNQSSSGLSEGWMSIWKVKAPLPAGRAISPKAERSERQVPRVGERAEEKGDII